MSRRIVIAFVVLTFAGMVAPGMGPVFAQQQAIYPVKFLCGFEPGSAGPKFPSEPPVKLGNYATAVNVINFHTFPVQICKVAEVALPEACFEPNPPEGHCSSFLGVRSPITLQPNQALEVDCNDIVNLFGGPSTSLPSFIKGFVAVVVFPQPGLSLNNPLGVTAVYTAQQCFAPLGTACTNQSTLLPAGVKVVPASSTLTEPSFCSNG